MKLALAMIVEGVDKEAEPLATCLSSVSQFVDGIFLTVTHKPGEQVSQQVLNVAKSFKATVSDFEWVYDFAAARNYNFSQVPKDYTHILWLDADDALRNASLLPKVIEEHPDVDAFIFNYLYAFDENKRPVVVHMKTQVVKNDGCVVWRGKLHEDFEAQRELNSYLVEGIDRLHLSNDKRIELAKVRNLEVAQKDLEQNPSDPRSYWNVGNAQKAMGLNQEAIDTFGTFLQLSQSEDEKYIARLRRAEAYWIMDQMDKGIEEAQFAIGLKPEFPDAYFLLGGMYFNTNRLEKARDMYLLGMIKPKPVHRIIVYNPREYDWEPLNNLAKVYFAMNLPQLALICLEGCLKIMPDDPRTQDLVKKMRPEADKADEVVKLVEKLRKIEDKAVLKAELDKIPKKYRAHPAVCNLYNVHFVKTESSGKDLVIFCGFTEEEWTPDTAKKKGIGGSEEAVIWLSQLLADKGWNVTVYNNCGAEEQKFGSVTYRPFWMWNMRDKQDAVVLWRTPRVADHDINTDKLYVDLHDVVKPGEFTEARLKKITKIFVKSKFHRSLFPNVPDNKFVIVPNGIDAKKFAVTLQRNPKLLVNTSSPDRSLEALLECYAEIKAKEPNVHLIWAYGWGVYDIVHSDNAEAMAWKNKIQKLMKELGIENPGRISHDEVAKLYLQAGIFAYPSEFAEIDCISLSKAMAAGAIPVTTDFAAMGEKQGHGGMFLHSDKTAETWGKRNEFSIESPTLRTEWVSKVVNLLGNPPSEQERTSMRQWAQETFDWSKIADVWNSTLCE